MNPIKPYLNQNFELLKEACLLNGSLFEDATFPANESSIWKANKPDCEKIYWKRPFEFISNPQFIVNNIEPSDLTQGQLGNWFVTILKRLKNNQNF